MKKMGKTTKSTRIRAGFAFVEAMTSSILLIIAIAGLFLSAGCALLMKIDAREYAAVPLAADRASFISVSAKRLLTPDISSTSGQRRKIILLDPSPAITKKKDDQTADMPTPTAT